MEWIGTLSFMEVKGRKSMLHYSSFNLERRHGVCLPVDWRSRFTPLHSVGYPGSDLQMSWPTVSILQGRDLRADPEVSMQVIKELFRVGGSLLRQLLRLIMLLLLR